MEGIKNYLIQTSPNTYYYVAGKTHETYSYISEVAIDTYNYVATKACDVYEYIIGDTTPKDCDDFVLIDTVIEEKNGKSYTKLKFTTVKQKTQPDVNIVSYSRRNDNDHIDEKLDEKIDKTVKKQIEN